MRKLLFTLTLIVWWLISSSAFAVYLDSSNIVSIGGGSCDLSATDCDLTSKNITWIAPNTFVNHTNLTWTLYLNNNEITSIESWTFNGLSNLKTLSLTFNQIVSIENGDFNGLPNLEALYIYNNQIASIESWDFNGLSNLLFLSIDWNKITSIESWDFNGLSSLSELIVSNMDWNPITNIRKWDFAGLSNITRLSMSYSQITTIESWAFNGLSNLNYLDLARNKITSIEKWDFSGIPNLNSLNLYSNQISSIENWSFDWLSLSDSFQISYNCIDVWVLSQSIIDLANIANPSRTDSQYVCAAISYNPSTSTSWPVTGTLIFTWWDPVKRAAVIAENLWFSPEHVWTINGNYGFNLLSLSDTNNYLHHSNLWYSVLTWNVTRIWWSLPPWGDLQSFIKDAQWNNINTWTNVKFNTFNYGDTWKSLIDIDTVYDISLNVKNDLGRGTEITDAILIPWGHRYRVSEFIPIDETKSIAVKVKYFVK